MIADSIAGASPRRAEDERLVWIVERLEQLMNDDDRTIVEALFVLDSAGSFDSTRAIIHRAIDSARSGELYMQVRRMSRMEADTILRRAAGGLRRLPQPEQERLLLRLENWCNILRAIEIAASYCEKSESAEVLSELKQTRHLLERFTRAPGQGWYSLHWRQINELHYDVATHISSLDRADQLGFIRDLFDKSSEMEARR
jgi:hypothetical protein